MVLAILLICAAGIIWWRVHWELDPAPGWVDCGATPAECLAAFHLSRDISGDVKLLSAHHRLYVTGGWSILVGFDEQDRAEHFMYSKFNMVRFSSGPVPVSAAEREDILDHFRGGSFWKQQPNQDFGSSWQRDDEERFAIFYPEWQGMVVMNWEYFNRQFKAIPGNEDKELAPPKAGVPQTQVEDDRS